MIPYISMIHPMKNLPYSILCGNLYIPWRRKVPGPRAVQDRLPGPSDRADSCSRRLRSTALALSSQVASHCMRCTCRKSWGKSMGENHRGNSLGKFYNSTGDWTGEIRSFSYGIQIGKWCLVVTNQWESCILHGMFDGMYHPVIEHDNGQLHYKRRFQCKNKSTHWFSIAVCDDRRVRRTDTFSTTLVVHMTCEPRFGGWHHE